ncbi:P-type conjugative transfer protein TrbJ, partial [Paracoccus denitrificans]|nr:P-type conjugative transfer protein TrbJ [Paracoccus denitrificans]
MTRNTTAIPHPVRRIASTTALAVALAIPLALAPVLTTPAHAFFGGFGRIVYDPTNHAENLLTAARSLEQINNQIASLQN